MVAPLARRREISWTIIWQLTFNSLAKVPPGNGIIAGRSGISEVVFVFLHLSFLSPVCWFVMKVTCYRVEPLSNMFWDVLMAGNR